MLDNKDFKDFRYSGFNPYDYIQDFNKTTKWCRVKKLPG